MDACNALSLIVGMPSGLILPLAFGIITLLAGNALYPNTISRYPLRLPFWGFTALH
jgi:hypothetical protein